MCVVVCVRARVVAARAVCVRRGRERGACGRVPSPRCINNEEAADVVGKRRGRAAAAKGQQRRHQQGGSICVRARWVVACGVCGVCVHANKGRIKAHHGQNNK